MVQKFFLGLAFFSLVPTLHIIAEEKRTDGPPGSEYGDFSHWDSGRFQLGIQFGAVLDADSEDGSFAIGGDVDYRPTDLFGVRASFLQAVQSPRHTLLSLNPLIHYDFSNLNWYVNFGPGLILVDGDDRELRFAIQAGAGADFFFDDKFGIGVLWNYSFTVDSVDFHTIGARLSYKF